MDFGQLAIDTLRDHAKLTQAGMEVGKKHADAELKAALRTILHAYDKALMEQPTTMSVALPTYLVAALESARKVVA